MYVLCINMLINMLLNLLDAQDKQTFLLVLTEQTADNTKVQ